MYHTKYSKDVSLSIAVYRKLLLLLFLIKTDVEFSNECGFLKSDTNRLCKGFKRTIIEQNQNYFDYIKTEQESIVEKIPTEEMKNYFATLFDDVRHGLSLKLFPLLRDPYR